MKKIISIIITLTMLLSTVTALAAEINMLDVNLIDSVITVKLDEANSGEKILLVVTNPGYEDNAADINYAVQNYTTLTADEEGKAEYSFKLYLPSDGEYNVYANGNKLTSFKYDIVAMKTVVETIVEYAKNNNKTDLETYIKDTDVLKSLALDNFDPIVSTQIGMDMSKVAEKLISEVNKNTFTGSDKENCAKMQNVIKTVVALELFNQNKADQYIYNNDGSLIHDSSLKLSAVDESKAVTLYAYYLNGYSEGTNEYTLTGDGKAAVKSALKGKNFVSTEELYKAFMEAVICIGTNNSMLKGQPDAITYGYVKGLLTDENKTATGVTGTITNFIANKLSGTTEKINDIQYLNSLISQYALLESQQNAGNGGGGGGGGGASAPGLSAGGTMTVTPVKDVNTAVQNDKNANENLKYSFSDIAEVEWAINAIEDLSAKGIINGTGDRKFEPNATVTREQFVKMLCVALGLTEEAEISFNDIASDDWSVPYIKKAVKAGLIAGVDENTFGYGVGISRQDIAVILHRTIKDATGTSNFNDVGEIADYATEAVGALSGLKILNGFEDGSFRPNASCTRAQAAVIIYNYLNR